MFNHTDMQDKYCDWCITCVHAHKCAVLFGVAGVVATELLHPGLCRFLNLACCLYSASSAGVNGRGVSVECISLFLKYPFAGIFRILVASRGSG